MTDVEDCIDRLLCPRCGASKRDSHGGVIPCHCSPAFAQEIRRRAAIVQEQQRQVGWNRQYSRKAA